VGSESRGRGSAPAHLSGAVGRPTFESAFLGPNCRSCLFVRVHQRTTRMTTTHFIDWARAFEPRLGSISPSPSPLLLFMVQCQRLLLFVLYTARAPVIAGRVRSLCCGDRPPVARKGPSSGRAQSRRCCGGGCVLLEGQPCEMARFI
jgi:hypothetical protein